MNANRKAHWAAAGVIAAMMIAASASNAGADPRKIYDNPFERGVGIGANKLATELDYILRIPIRLVVFGGTIQLPRLPLGEDVWQPPVGVPFSD